MTSKTIDGVSRELLERAVDCTGEDGWEAIVEELRALLAAPEAPRQEPVMKLEAERLWGGAGEYAVSFVKSGWLDECRKAGGTFMLYAAPLSPNHSGGAGKVVLPDRSYDVATVRHLQTVMALFSPEDLKNVRALLDAQNYIDKVKELNQ